MMINDKNTDLDYKNVFLIPQYSEVTSRKQVDTSVTVTSKSAYRNELSLKIDVPVISANMDSVTDGNMCIAMHEAGAIGAMHRFLTIEQNVSEFEKVSNAGAKCFVSIGVNEESKERAEALYNAGARHFVIDIAHGHSIMMKDMLTWMKGRFGSTVIIMAGNVATGTGAIDLVMWGANIVKVGIGPGAVCLTKNVTGTTRPQFSAVMECAKAVSVPVVADGGIVEIGDICKAIAAGAFAVMSGRMFAGCMEAPGGVDMSGQKLYRGMASRDAMLTIRKDDGTLPTPEGKTTTVARDGNAKEVVKNIKGGLQSAMSYSNAKTIKEFHTKALFGIRMV